MKYSRSFFTVIVILAAVWVAGCVSESTAPVVQPPKEIVTYKPKGTISGKIFDRCTNAAIAGAVLSVGFDGGVATTSSDQSGSFSFADVPAGSFRVTSGGAVFSGTYLITASLVNYNAGQTAADKRYRNYYYLPATITFTSLVPGDSLGVSGLVGAMPPFSISTLNTMINGTVVDQNMQPVANAVVTLLDQTIIPGVVMQQTTTSASGAYSFSNVDNGITVAVSAMSRDGSLQTAAPVGRSIPCNLTTDTMRAEVTIERIMLTPADNVAPYVISISPANNADILPSGLQVAYIFSEPIKQTAYTRTDLGFGHGTIIDDITVNFNGLKKSTGLVPFGAQWDPTYTRLTVTPQGVVGSAKYSLTIQPALAKLQDEAGVGVTNNPNIIGDFETLNFTTAGGTTGPAAPVLTQRTNPDLFPPLDYSGGVVGLEWNYDVNVRSYNIYRSIGTGPFELISPQSGYFRLQANAASGSLVYPSAANNPLGAVSVRFQVTAVSKDLMEGAASNIITVHDAVQPRLTGASVLNPATNTYVYTVHFSEPLIQGNAENTGNYNFAGTVNFNVNRADYLGYNAINDYVVRLSVTTTGVAVSPYSLTASTGVADLAGNTIDPNNNKANF